MAAYTLVCLGYRSGGISLTSNRTTGTGSNCQIGNYPWSSPGQYLNGYIDEVMFFGVQLSAAQISTFYTSFP